MGLQTPDQGMRYRRNRNVHVLAVTNLHRTTQSDMEQERVHLQCSLVVMLNGSFVSASIKVVESQPLVREVSFLEKPATHGYYKVYARARRMLEGPVEDA